MPCAFDFSMPQLLVHELICTYKKWWYDLLHASVQKCTHEWALSSIYYTWNGQWDTWIEWFLSLSLDIISKGVNQLVVGISGFQTSRQNGCTQLDSLSNHNGEPAMIMTIRIRYGVDLGYSPRGLGLHVMSMAFERPLDDLRTLLPQQLGHPTHTKYVSISDQWSWSVPTMRKYGNHRLHPTHSLIEV